MSKPKFPISNQIQKSKSKVGFTLVETLVAISILSLSIVATFTAVQNGIKDSTYAKDQITAFYLAQEAMEFIKNKRDENALNSINGGSNKWLTGLSDLAGDKCYFGKICKIDVTVSSPNNILYCGSTFGSCSVLNQNSTSGLFGYTSGSGWTQTIFKRGIKFEQIVLDKEVRVTIQMSWAGRFGNKSFQVTETLFNRQ